MLLPLTTSAIVTFTASALTLIIGYIFGRTYPARRERRAHKKINRPWRVETDDRR